MKGPMMDLKMAERMELMKMKAWKMASKKVLTKELKKDRMMDLMTAERMD